MKYLNLVNQNLNLNWEDIFVSSPFKIWIKAYDVVSQAHPNGSFYKAYWDVEDPYRYGICPWGIEKKISLLVKDRKFHDGHTEFWYAIDHRYCDSKVHGTQINSTIHHCILMHLCPKKHWHSYWSQENKLKMISVRN